MTPPKSRRKLSLSLAILLSGVFVTAPGAPASRDAAET
jgi:hypothetical protein